MKITRQVFIDANIFTYLLTGHPTYGRSCQELLEKVEQGNIEAFISPLVIDEVSYILMVQTARRQEARKTQDQEKKRCYMPGKIALCLCMSFMAISTCSSPKDI
jgi:predicted nucleic acid-binding protein